MSFSGPGLLETPFQVPIMNVSEAKATKMAFKELAKSKDVNY